MGIREEPGMFANLPLRARDIRSVPGRGKIEKEKKSKMSSGRSEE